MSRHRSSLPPLRSAFRDDRCRTPGDQFRRGPRFMVPPERKRQHDPPLARVVPIGQRTAPKKVPGGSCGWSERVADGATGRTENGGWRGGPSRANHLARARLLGTRRRMRLPDGGPDLVSGRREWAAACRRAEGASYMADAGSQRLGLVAEGVGMVYRRGRAETTALI